MFRKQTTFNMPRNMCLKAHVENRPTCPHVSSHRYGYRANYMCIPQCEVVCLQCACLQNFSTHTHTHVKSHTHMHTQSVPPHASGASLHIHKHTLIFILLLNVTKSSPLVDVLGEEPLTGFDSWTSHLFGSHNPRKLFSVGHTTDTMLGKCDSEVSYTTWFCPTVQPRLGRRREACQ